MKTPMISPWLAAGIAAAVISLGAALPAQAQTVTPAAVQKDDSLYRALGGLEVLTKVVDDTLALALADPRIKDTFKDSDMKKLAKLITEQFCDLSGGPCTYSGDPMKEVHQGLALNNMHFNALVEDLQAAMDKSHIPSRTQNKLLALLAPMQRTVVTK